MLAWTSKTAAGPEWAADQKARAIRADIAERTGARTFMRGTRVRCRGRSALLTSTLLLLLRLLPAAGATETWVAPSIATPSPVTGATVASAGRARFFRGRVSYYPNADASFNIERIIQSGDVARNPGPDRPDGEAVDSAPPGPVAAAGITMVCQNVRSIRGKLGDLRSLSPSLVSLSILALTETWLNPAVSTSELEYGLPGHIWFRRDRLARGGGVACAVDARLRPVRREDLERERTETRAIELRSRPNIILIVCYCPPADAAVLAETLIAIQEAAFLNPTKCIVVTGDFNLPYIHWAPSGAGFAFPTLAKTCGRSTLFLDACRLTGLRQHVHQPTRGDNVLDLVLSSEGVGVETSVEDGLLCSDHREVFCSIQASYPAVQLATRTTALNYKRADWDGLRQSLRLLPWVDLLNDPCVNQNAEKFYALLEAAIEDSIPTVTLRRRYPPWFDGELRTALSGKEAAFRRQKRNPSPDNKRDFTEKRRAFKAASQRKFSEYLRKLVSNFKDNPKRFWTYVKCIKTSKKTAPVLTYGGTTAITDVERADLLNRTFAAKFALPSADPLPDAPTYDVPYLSDLIVTEGDVLRILNAIECNKACGPDGISARIVRECAVELAVPLTVLYKQAILQGIFPDKWKMANIVPIHKKGSLKLASNYRSVSLLPLFGKVFERVIYDSLYAHVCHCLSPAQHGFIPHRSCDSNLACIVHAGWQAIASGTQLDCIYTDFSAAFQSVDHRLLIHKLKESYCITGQTLALLKSFLSNRQQRVVLNGKTSPWVPVTSGTPEGSLLSPLLFTLFINDLPSSVNCSCLMYADDVKIYREVCTRDDADMLHADLVNLDNWSSTWKLKLNAAKCKSFTITLRRAPIISHYSIGGETLERVETMRELGVILDQKLTFGPHIEGIIKKANSALGLLIRSLQTGRGTRARFETAAIIATYHANVRSLLEYCSVIWNGAAKTHTDRIERIQHKFLIWLSVHSNVSTFS